MTLTEEGEKMRDGLHWPIGVITSVILIVIACAVTIYVALLQPVQEDADMMLGYHNLDASANDMIIAGIKFNAKYKLTYIGEGVSLEGSSIAYKIEDMDANPVNNAVVKVVLSRPIIEENQIELENPHVENGVYTFENVKVAKEGRWNILAKVTVNEDFRHMNLKSDTADKDVYEYGLDKPMRNYAANGGRTL
jgi:nitrogen fixation protein FixH